MLVHIKKDQNTPTGASTNPKILDLNKTLNLIEIEIGNWKFEIENLKFEIEI